MGILSSLRSGMCNHSFEREEEIPFVDSERLEDGSRYTRGLFCTDVCEHCGAVRIEESVENEVIVGSEPSDDELPDWAR